MVPCISPWSSQKDMVGSCLIYFAHQNITPTYFFYVEDHCEIRIPSGDIFSTYFPIIISFLLWKTSRKPFSFGDLCVSLLRRHATRKRVPRPAYHLIILFLPYRRLCIHQYLIPNRSNRCN